MSASRSPRGATLAAYSLPAVPLSLLWAPIVVWLPAFYIQEVGLGLAATGLVFLSARVWDGITDVVMGVVTDRTQQQFGRRPWIIGGSVLLIVSTHFLMRPTAGAGVAYLGICIFLFYLAWTITQIPYLAWGADLSSDYRGRGRVVGFRGMGSAAGILIAATLPVILFGESATPGQVLSAYSTAILLILPPAVLFAAMVVPEGRHAPRAHTPNWRSIAAALAKNRPFQIFLLAFFFWDVALALIEVGAFFIAERVLGLEGQFHKLFAITYIATLISTPFTVRLANRIGKHKTFAFSAIMLALGCTVLITTRSGAIAGAVSGNICLGLAVSGFWALPTSMVADVVDVSRLDGGHDQTGLHMAIFNLTWKLAMATGVAIGLPLMGYLGFDPAVEGPATNEALFALKFVGLGLPILCAVASALIIWRYPLNEAVHLEIRKRLDKAAAGAD